MVVSSVLSILFVLLGTIFLIAAHNPSEYYTSVKNMEYLLDSERTILKRLDKYIRLSEEKIKFLKREQAKLESELEGASKDKIAFLSNPINAFLMTKRLVKGYSKIDELMQMNVGVSLIDNSTMLPAFDDYIGVADGLANLQHVYQLDTADLAAGKLRGSETGRVLAADECFSIGSVMGLAKQFKYSVSWLKEALRRFELETSPGISKSEILDYLSYSLAEVGEYEEAMERTNQLLKLVPDHVNGLQKQKVIAEWLEHVEKYGPKPNTEVDRGLYEVLCRGEHPRPIEELSKLRCRYETSKSPFLRIAPFKLEEASLDPVVEIFHEVLSDKEIEKLLELGRPTIRRSMVGENSNKEVSKSRTSQNGWLNDDVQPLVRTVTLRTIDMSGLDEKGYESLQINNYGIGGHYLPHYDWTRPVGDAPVYVELGLGNRIATVMYYLSDVEQGGATVFPQLGFGVFPKRGRAIFWYNLHRNGTGDERTLHAACPVLIGSKWVANKWIHEYHQEFRRPCDLNQEK
ncbi:prolyl 4-hydroxylase subunit alpha-2-like [Topomyia yanbarensis]|uniref:prolyl 4-hydroxylase subunit alpha-2-like n=1 Tax=Topomyia yanbarensis TaxID=2498891 RepID=UPI00273C24BC|nr:prolyl 4-hydroxylase subunit alpha-2-like [Topomyia yanbarensis]